MPSLVVDASVAIKWFNPAEDLADRANLIRDDYVHGRITLVVPAFWDYEIVNGINKAVARHDLTAEEGRNAVRLMLAVHAQRVALPPPHESYELAQRYQRSVYDSWYLALAEQTACEFWTADRKLYNAVHEQWPLSDGWRITKRPRLLLMRTREVGPNGKKQRWCMNLPVVLDTRWIDLHAVDIRNPDCQ